MRPLSVLSVASEAYPLIKTGGLADVVGALPAALTAQGATVRTLLPGYPSVMVALEEAGAVADLDGLTGPDARLLAGRAGGLDVFVLDAPRLYRRPGNPYADPDGQDWPDNAQRFAALAHAADWLGRGGLTSWAPDIVHAHDWQAGLAPALLRRDGRRRPGTVMTVHNLAFQGQFPSRLLAELGLPAGIYDVEGVEYYGAIGYLKAGLYFADRITTVSPTYAAEIATPGSGMGLDGLLRSRARDLHGILNGLDEAVWNPATDPILDAAFDANDLSGRQACRMALRREMRLDPEPGAALLGMVSRLSWQKGADLLLDTVPGLVRDGVQVAILGSGDPALHDRALALARVHPGRVAVRIGHDERLAHAMQAGCDVICVPSRFEPCGLTQLAAMRYGAVPLVCRTGGLADTVIDANAAALDAGVATGIQFHPASRGALEAALARMSVLWREPQTWRRVQLNGLDAQLGWGRSAKRYMSLYRTILEEHGDEAGSVEPQVTLAAPLAFTAR